jgi:Putative cyclase
MCNACVMDAVKDRMMSRRRLFGAAGTMGAAAALSGLGVTAARAEARSFGAVHDMTYTLTEDFPTYDGVQQLFIKELYNYAKDSFNQKEYRINEHTGTHVDAPLHFSADGSSVDMIPVEKLVVPLAVIDIRERAAGNPDA